MKKALAKRPDDELRPEYDLSKLKGGVRGKYYRQRPRAGWAEAAKRMRQRADDTLLDAPTATRFDQEE